MEDKESSPGIKSNACESVVRHTTNYLPPGGSERIISVGDYIDNSFPALGCSDPREVSLEL